MNGVGWVALGTAIALAPGPPAAHLRAEALRDRASPPPTEVAPAAGSAWDLRVVALGCCLGVTVLVTVVAGPVLGMTAGVAAATASALAVVARSGRTAARRERDLVTALHLLSAELSSGALPESALRAAAAACPAYQADLGDAADAMRRGDPPEFDTPALLPLGRAWQVAADTGAPLASVVERVAGDVTGRIALRRDVTAAVAGARSSAFLLAVLPVLGVLLGTAMQANPLHVLFGSSAGRMLCLVGVLLDACGVAWTHRLAARAQRA
jgi:tight adherence protein B